jgi:hypothetical protein
LRKKIMSGGGGSSTTVQQADPWKGVQPYLLDAYARAADLYGSGQNPQYYPGSTIASFNPQMWEAMGAQQGFSGDLFNALQASQGTFLNTPEALAQAYWQLPQQGEGVFRGTPQDLFGMYMQGAQQAGSAAQNVTNQMQQQWLSQLDPSRLDVANNPLLQSAAQAAINPIFQNLQESVLPQIAMHGVGTGTLGGSRNDLAQAQAIERSSAQAADATTRMYAQAYENEANRQLQALGLGGQIGQMQMLPLQAMLQGGQAGFGNLFAGEQAYGGMMLGAGQAGMENLFQGQGSYLQNLGSLGQLGLMNLMEPAQLMQGMDQAQLDDLVNRWNYEQNIPYDMLNQYMSLLSATPWGSSTSQMMPGTNPLVSGLGGGLMGYGGATLLGATNPWLWAGMGALGAVL